MQHAPRCWPVLLLSMFAFCVLALNSKAQPAYWASLYGGSGEEYVSDIQLTADGGSIVAGWSDSFAAGVDMWVVKLDAAGQILWQKVYETSCADYASAIQPTSDGGYIVAGGSDCYQFKPSFEMVQEAILLKLDDSGQIVWQKHYGGPEHDYAESVHQLADGGFLVAGWTESFGAGARDAWIFRVDAAGTILWQKAYGSAGTDNLSAFQVLPGGGAVAVGVTDVPDTNDTAVWVYAIADNGDVLWEHTFGTTDWLCEGSAVSATADGGYLLTGKKSPGEDVFGEGLVIKLDGDGNLVWQKQFLSTSGNGLRSVFPYALQPTTDGGAVLAGWTNTLRMWLATVDDHGDVVWQFLYASEYPGHMTTLEQVVAGGYVAAGLLEPEGIGAGNSEGAVFRISDDGKLPDYALQEVCPVDLVDSSELLPLTIGHSSIDTDATSEDANLYPIDSDAEQFFLIPMRVMERELALDDERGIYTYSGVLPGTQKTATFTITNAGPVSLQLTGSPLVSIDSASPDFQVSKQPKKNTIAAGESETFDVTYTPTTPDTQIATVVIESNDRNTTPYTFTLFGRVERKGAPFAALYGGDAWDETYHVGGASDGGYVVAGKTSSFGVGDYDAWIMKLNQDGGIEWQKTYGGAGSEIACFIQQTADSGYIVAGVTSTWSDFYDVWLMKLGTAGNIEWQHTYGRTAAPYNRFSIDLAPDGGYIAAYTTPSYDVWVGKLDSSGRIEWQNSYGGSSTEQFLAIRQANNGDYFVLAMTYSFGAGGFDLWLLKLDPAGNILWQYAYGQTTYDYPYDIQPTSDGGCLVLGIISNATSILLKLGSDGSILWHKGYSDAQAHAPFFSIQTTTDNGYVALGRGILKIDAQGNQLWHKPGGGSSILQTPDGGFFIEMSTDGFGAKWLDALLFKLDQEGNFGDCQLWDTLPQIQSVNAEITVTPTTAVKQPTAVEVKDTEARVLTAGIMPEFLCEAPVPSETCGGVDEHLDFSVPSGGTIHCRAANSIRLLPGFHAEEGSVFRGYIEE